MNHKTLVPNAETTTLMDVIRWRARYQPDRRALTFLENGEIENGFLSFAELDRQSRAIGALLQNLRASGERALLFYPQGLEFLTAFLGCLYAGVVAIPAYPPRLNRPHSQVQTQAIVADAQATFALSTNQIISSLRNGSVPSSYMDGLHWVATDTVSEEWAERWREPSVARDSLAYLQYTSGSTREPKGVMVSHGNLMYNLAYIECAMEFAPTSVVLTWLPSMHDMGLVIGILESLYVGSPAYLMTPLSFVQSPIRWLQAISRYGVTHSGAPNFAYDLCIHKTLPEQRTSLNLSSWIVAYNGSEPVRQLTLQRFAEVFGPCGFRRTSWYPCYGLAESVLMVSGGRTADPPVISTLHAGALGQNRVLSASPGGPDTLSLVGNGRGTADTRVIAVDPESFTQCAPREVGELWVSGPTVAQGYWNFPEETASTFQAYLADTGEGPFLRTGDLGFLEEGELFVTGRLKDVIVIRGRNYYPQDIELTVEQSHPSLRLNSTAAFSVEVGEEERLVVVQEVKRECLKGLGVEHVAQEIRRWVAENHGLHIYVVVLVRPASIPKTPSGKIQRRGCRDQFLRDILDVLGVSRLDAPHEHSYSDYWELNGSTGKQEFFQLDPKSRLSWLKSYLLEHLAQSLGVAPWQLDPQLSVNDLGLDSLMVAELQHKVAVDLGVSLSFEMLLDDTSVTQLAGEACEQLAAVGPLLAAETEDPRAPSFDQSPPPNGVDYDTLDYGKWSLFQRIVRKLGRPLLRLVARIQIEGLENIPSSGPALLAFNHLHFSDGFLFFIFVPRRLVFLVGEHWQTRRIFNWIFSHLGTAIYVNRGKGDLQAISQALAVLRAGGAICIAPEGGISEGATLGRGKSGIARLSTLALAPIVPMVAYGQEGTGKYWKRLRRVPVHVRIGPPIEPPPDENGWQDMQGYTDKVMGELARMLPPDYRGVYEHVITEPIEQPGSVGID